MLPNVEDVLFSICILLDFPKKFCKTLLIKILSKYSAEPHQPSKWSLGSYVTAKRKLEWQWSHFHLFPKSNISVLYFRQNLIYWQHTQLVGYFFNGISGITHKWPVESKNSVTSSLGTRNWCGINFFLNLLCGIHKIGFRWAVRLHWGSLRHSLLQVNSYLRQLSIIQHLKPVWCVRFSSSNFITSSTKATAKSHLNQYSTTSR